MMWVNKKDPRAIYFDRRDEDVKREWCRARLREMRMENGQVAWEDVEVPAGKFKALRLKYERSGSNRNAASETIWYAPDAKVVVKRIQARPGGQRSRDITTTELLAYKFN